MRTHTSTLLLVLSSLFCSDLSADTPTSDYIGSSECRQCHESEFSEWQGSHHQLAMASANADTVLGDFSDIRFTYNGVTSRFFKDDGKYKVTTDNDKGELETFEIRYTFGWEPLQQYLIEFDDGRYQALSIAWDSRSKKDGGQRWFHLYPDQQVSAGDPLHWTRFGHNWNTNCAECHSTKLEKNYEPETNTFNTTWEEISVGCEACHGPGATHIDWASQDIETRQKSDSKGLVVDVVDTLHWQRQPDQKHASIAVDSDSASASSAPRQQEVCASCHARRFKWDDDLDTSFANNHHLQVVSPGVYHEDGQIQDEVYVYGSFLQSKMHDEGVTCSNCHNPHSNKLKAEDNGLCLQCHSAEAFNTTKHHLHPPQSEGAACINCHMPQTTYMVIDPRADHSIRVPRPDLSIDSDIPNACNQCHDDQTPAWAAEALVAAHGQPKRHYGAALAGIWEGNSRSLNRLLRLLGNNAIPDTLKAAALQHSAHFSDPRLLSTATRALRDANPQIRLAAIDALGNLPINDRYQLLFPLLSDNSPIVKREAAANLVDIPLDQLPASARKTLEPALHNYEAALKKQLDSPAMATRLGGYYAAKGEYQKAINAYQLASQVEPDFIPALLNLADVYRLQQDEDKVLSTLKRAESTNSGVPDVSYVLGLAYVRQGDRIKATNYFAEAVTLAPERSDLRYAWVLSQFELGEHADAIKNAQTGLAFNPDDPEIGYLLGYFYEETGQTEKAKSTYRHVVKKHPRHEAAASRLAVLENASTR